MLFSTPEFLFVFLPLVFAGYFGLLKWRLTRAATGWLVVAGFVFYGFWNVAYLPLLLISILFNFSAGIVLARCSREAPGDRQGRLLLVLAVGVNLALLGYYKYAHFVLSHLATLIDWPWPIPDPVLPLGISFFTFTQIAFLVDSHRGLARDYDLLNYALFVNFFPHLIAGPILHHAEMMPQFRSRWNRVIRYRNVFEGLYLFSVGLFKKVIMADGFAVWADQGFAPGGAYDFFSAWAATLSYTLQIYFDFSGYCDMALGSALLFNIRLPINFKSPYRALSIQAFWRCWHITLGRYLRDYVYIPLGGNRGSRWNESMNLMITFALGGVWHGASGLFLLWGLLHGLALVIHRAWRQWGFPLPRVMAWGVTFLFVNVTWVFFRADSLESALSLLQWMFPLHSVSEVSLAEIPTARLVLGGVWTDPLLERLPLGLVAVLPACLGVAIGLGGVLIPDNLYQLSPRVGVRGKFWGSLVLLVVSGYAMMMTTSEVFLYYNF